MQQMKILFRVDASLIIGTGHVMRCLVLAMEMAKTGAKCHFACREHPGNLIEFIRQQGFEVAALPISMDQQITGVEAEVVDLAHEAWLGCDWSTDAAQTKVIVGGMVNDWLVVDHYALDARWESAMRDISKKIMVIDDLADRSHDCDVLLDQNLGKTKENYLAWVSASCKLLLGPRHALLRPEFAASRAKSLSRRNQGGLRRILITMGGVDLHNATGAVLEAIHAWRQSVNNLEFTVVMGPSAPWRDHVIQQARHLPFPTEVLMNTLSMADLMCNADLAIGAAGSSAWERCCLGLPTLQFILADNQYSIANALNNAGAALFMERTDMTSTLGMVMDQLMRDPMRMLGMSTAASMLVDGLGSERVARYLQEGLEV